MPGRGRLEIVEMAAADLSVREWRPGNARRSRMRRESPPGTRRRQSGRRGSRIARPLEPDPDRGSRRSAAWLGSCYRCCDCGAAEFRLLMPKPSSWGGFCWGRMDQTNELCSTLFRCRLAEQDRWQDAEQIGRTSRWSGAMRGKRVRGYPPFKNTFVNRRFSCWFLLFEKPTSTWRASKNFSAVARMA
ncbi:hypothetical protein VTK26DRAFT_4186 [Humicola hyalothermophila]